MRPRIMSAPPPVLPLLLLCVAAHVPVVLGLQCYVCVPQSDTNISDVLHIFPKFPANLTCESFMNNNRRYMWDCPHNYTGCVMVTDGSKVIRTCGEVPVNDCKMANKVEYCYCMDALCNGARRPFPATLPPPPPSDDEDLEGSGGGPADNRNNPSTTPTTTAIIPTTATQSAANFHHSPLHRTVPVALLLITSASLWLH